MSHLVRSLAVAACAVAAAAAVAPVAARDAKPSAPSIQYGSVDAQGVYRLSADEQALDCKKLLGSMQIRILQLRGYDPSKNASGLSRSMQKVTDPVFGVMLGKTTKHDMDATSRYRTDRAMVEAYNRKAAAKGCKVYDIEAELAPGKTMRDMPIARAPQAPAAAAPTKK